MKKYNLYNVDSITFNGSINNKFYIFCLRKQPNLIRFFFLRTFYLIMYCLSPKFKNKYHNSKYYYYNSINNRNLLINDFCNKYGNKITTWYRLNSTNNDYILSYIPIELLTGLLKKMDITNIIAPSIKDYFCKSYNKIIEDLELQVNNKNFNNIYINKKFKKFNIKNYEKKYISNKNKFVFLNSSNGNYISKYLKNSEICNIIFITLIIMLLSLIITIFSLTFTTAVFDINMFESYFDNFLLIFLNMLPTFILMLFIYILSSRLWISFSITSVFIVLLSFINKTKLFYRDDPFMFEDLSLWKEALIMSKRYDIMISFKRTILLILLIIIAFILFRFVKKPFIKWKSKILILVGIIILIVPIYKNIYLNDKLYDNLGNKDIINVWIATRQFQIRGFIYPFIHSSKNIIKKVPDDYNENEIRNILLKYSSENIPENKKVNIISIMLEAYNDFSKFDTISFNKDIYEKLHNIQSKSYSGNLNTTIFGGETIVTERNFLTGYYKFPSFRQNTNSYVWYFKNQGYYTEAMHPVYGAFYNRKSVNINLGFDKYLNYENKFSDINSKFLSDINFFDYIIEGYTNSKNRNIPYFNFSVTYQNHGPYPAIDNGYRYIKNNGYSEWVYNTINNYFHGIKKTNDALEKLINYFEQENEPVIIIFFGDHNPYLGENNIGYIESNINLDLNTIDGYRNYYETPYVIWANDTAKNIFNKDFVGVGNNISPIFLMNELFDYVDLKGNEYLQYMSNLKKQIDVVNDTYLKINNNYVSPDDTNLYLVNEFKKVNYYIANNYDFNK